MAGCHHCSAGADDTAQHTLEIGPAWSNERRAVVASIRQDLVVPGRGQGYGWEPRKVEQHRLPL